MQPDPLPAANPVPYLPGSQPAPHCLLQSEHPVPGIRTFRDQHEEQRYRRGTSPLTPLARAVDSDPWCGQGHDRCLGVKTDRICRF
jgi:hypothetical protein